MMGAKETHAALLEALYQYESDLLYPPTGASRERRLDRVRKVIAQANAAPDLCRAAERALNYIENTEGELGIRLESGDMLRAALARTDQGEGG